MKNCCLRRIKNKLLSLKSRSYRKLQKSWQKKYFSKKENDSMSVLPSSAKDCPYYDWEQIFGIDGALVAFLTMFGSWIREFGNCEDRKEISHQIWTFRSKVKKACSVFDESQAFIEKELKDNFGPFTISSCFFNDTQEYDFVFDKSHSYSDEELDKITKDLSTKCAQLYKELLYYKDRAAAEKQLHKEIKEYCEEKFGISIESIKLKPSGTHSLYHVFENFHEPDKAIDDEWRRHKGIEISTFYDKLFKKQVIWQMNETNKRWKEAFDYLVEPVSNADSSSSQEIEYTYPRMTGWWD